MDIRYPIPASCLNQLWETLIYNTKKVMESYIPNLLLRAYDMKLLTHQESIAAFARACFLNGLAARSNTSAETKPPTEAWLGIGAGH